MSVQLKLTWAWVDAIVVNGARAVGTGAGGVLTVDCPRAGPAWGSLGAGWQLH